MKQIGIFLIGIGVLALIYSGFQYTTKEKVVDLGPITIDKKEKKSIDWPPITGALLIIGGVVVLIMDKKR